MRRLIVNADDFGLTRGVNRAIGEAHERGIVTSTTLMACGAQFGDAVKRAHTFPKLSVGCHVVLVDGIPVGEKQESSPHTRSGLIEGSGKFRQSILSFAWRAVAGQLDAAEIEQEITAQIHKLQSAGIAISHLDSHKHTHMFPVVLNALLRAAKNCGVRAIRNPFEPLVLARTRHRKRQFQLRILRRYQGRFREAIARSGVVTTDGCVGIVATGGLTVESFTELIRGLPEGTWEFVSHPGYNDAELDQVATRLRRSREVELGIMTSPEIKELLKTEKIQLISYGDLAAEAGIAPEVLSPLTAKS